MAPAVLTTPRSPAHKEKLMDTTSVAYVLCRIEDDSSLTPISEHEDIVAAVVAGKQKVEVEVFDFNYGVYADGARVICFAEGRIGYREWARRNGRLADIHSLDDRYDHEIDELMA
jgi:hypothetical protein